MYGTEVPAYRTLVEVCEEINTEVLAARGDTAQRLGSIERVTAERHGAIRVGTPEELAQAAQLFAGFGMFPVGFYDLRDAYPSPIPVVSTAFRPVDENELARNPFRVFTSLLVPEDRRFFGEDLERRLREFLGERTLFSQELIELARRSSADGGLARDDVDRFVSMAVQCFALSSDPWIAAGTRNSSRFGAWRPTSVGYGPPTSITSPPGCSTSTSCTCGCRTAASR